MKEKVAPYVRVSTREQAEHGYSVDEQIERTSKYCESMGWSVFKVYTDAGYSGGNTDRPGLQMLIEDVKAGHIDKVLVYKLDRLSRSQLDTLYLIEKVFLANNTDFVSMSENFDTSSPFGKAMIGILAVFAQLEREQIKERMKLGQDARAKQGKFRGARPPVGYEYINGELVIHEFEKMQVQKVYELYLKGYGYPRIEKYMEAHGYYTRFGRWHRGLISRALKNRIYIGEIKHRDNYYKGLHEPIIEKDMFDKVQRIKSQKRANNLEYNRRPGRASSYLSGFLICGNCGAKYTRIQSKATLKSGDRIIRRYYSCNSRAKKTPHLIKDPTCKNKIWKTDEIEEIVFNEIRKLAMDNSLIARSEKDNQQETVLNKEISKIEKDISKLIDLYTLDGISKNTLQVKIIALDDKKAKIQQELDFIKQDMRISIKDAAEKANSFDDILKNGSFEEIRVIIEALIDKIVIDGDDITIYWSFS